MLPGVFSLNERLTAYAAGVPSLSCVYRKVISELSLLPEGLPAVAACMRPVAQVHLSVPRQRRYIPELAATNGARVGFFAGVDSLVPHEIRLVRKLLVTR